MQNWRTNVYGVIWFTLGKCKWHLISKIVLTYCEKNCSSDWVSFLNFETEGWEFAKFLRSLEQFGPTVKGQNNFWIGIIFQLTGSSNQIWNIGTIGMLIGTNNWNVEIYRNKLKKRKWIIAFVWQKARYFLLSVSGIRIHIFLKWVSKAQAKCSLGIAQFPYCFFFHWISFQIPFFCYLFLLSRDS